MSQGFDSAWYRQFLEQSAQRAERTVNLILEGNREAAVPAVKESLTTQVSEEASCVTCEADQHVALMKWADFHGIAYEHSRMDRATSGIVGTPDFYFMRDGKVIWVEMKFGKGKLTKAQEERQAVLRTCGILGTTSYTIADAIAFVKSQLLNPGN
jgi:hypothetical protein